MAELFVEVGTEELPARFVAAAIDGFAANMVKLLAPLAVSPPRCWATPRRFAVAFDNLPSATPREERLVSGPPVAVAFRDGVATPAGVAFAAKFGLTADRLERLAGPKGEVVAARSFEGGQSLADLVAQGLEGAILSIPFKKTMRWGSRREAFARPIRHVCAVIDGERVACTVRGRDTTSTSDGHWLLSPEAFPVTSASEWVQQMRGRHVLVEFDERRSAIRHGLAAQAARLGVDLAPVPGGGVDEALFAEVVNLVEAPTVLAGAFHASLLTLPPRLLVESMKVNQRYFPTYREGRLTEHFLFASNNPAGNAELIAAGNARVLAARFSDAKFFFEEDRKKSLAEHGARLEGMVWMRNQGTMASRQAEVALAAKHLAGLFGADPAATLAAGQLCKCDLATQMVGEFPELQGHVGRLLAEGEGIAEALAIEEHYHPRFSGDSLPSTPAGVVLALAERITLLSRAFAAGLQPKGGADPLGLRRAANGIVAILLAQAAQTPRRDPGLATCFAAVKEPLGSEIREFIRARLRASLGESGIPTDVVDAAMAAKVHESDLVAQAARAGALGELADEGELGAIRATFRRVAGLVKQDPGEVLALHDLDGDSLGEPGRALRDAVVSVPDGSDVRRQVAALVALRPLVDAYFDGVMVMSEVPAERAARLGLLRVIVARFETLADFSKLVT